MHRKRTKFYMIKLCAQNDPLKSQHTCEHVMSFLIVATCDVSAAPHEPLSFLIGKHRHKNSLTKNASAQNSIDLEICQQKQTKQIFDRTLYDIYRHGKASTATAPTQNYLHRIFSLRDYSVSTLFL